jgi:hypothetical protein
MTITAVFSLCGYRTRELDLVPVLGLTLLVGVVLLMGAHL